MSMVRCAAPSILAIVQARMNSTRLPGKVLLPLPNGRSVLATLLTTLCRCPSITHVIVATSSGSLDIPIVQECVCEDVEVFTGSEHDVLGRMAQAAKPYLPDHVVRITADCPMLRVEDVESVVSAHLEGNWDLTYNTRDKGRGDGRDVEIMSYPILVLTDAKATDPLDREHVTRYIRHRPFKNQYVDPGDQFSCSLNTREDYTIICAWFEEHQNGRT